MDLDISVWFSLKGEDRKSGATELLLAYSHTNVDQFEVTVYLLNWILFTL